MSLSLDSIIKTTLDLKLGQLSAHGALMVDTGTRTGRSTKERYLVDRPEIHNDISWGAVNQPIDPSKAATIEAGIRAQLQKSTYEYKGFVGPFRIHVQSTCPWHIAFCENMFRSEAFAPLAAQFANEKPIEVLHDPFAGGANKETWIILDFVERKILVQGTLYAGEVKKAAFTTCNYLLPKFGIFPMHASANCLADGTSSCVLFGLSGTGKTTLSQAPDRHLIGDDEIIWTDQGLCNLEGGCYAKLIDLSAEREPEIFAAIQNKRAILENVVADAKGNVNFADRSKTENTRGSYPLTVLPNVFAQNKLATSPRTVVFLTADAFGALPAVAKLDANQTKTFFKAGYTAKVAGTELGVKEPSATFSPCFGGPFMPRPSQVYADLLVNHVQKAGATVWLLNTGWTGGPYGVGSRFPIPVSRAILRAIQSGELNKASMQKHEAFGFEVPTSCPGVDAKYLQIPQGPEVAKLTEQFRKNGLI